jgi:hypothetical protein
MSVKHASHWTTGMSREAACVARGATDNFRVVIGLVPRIQKTTRLRSSGGLDARNKSEHDKVGVYAR